jgi:hypothetical protein
MARAYLDTLPDVNFVAIDWSNMASGDYSTNAAPNTEKVRIKLLKIFIYIHTCTNLKIHLRNPGAL